MGKRKCVIFLLIFFISHPVWAKSLHQNTIHGECIHVFDGDTLLVRVGNKEEKVRLIGVDTPEVAGPYTKQEYFGKEASAYTKKMVKGKKVFLEFDKEKRDKYGRMLAYVYLSKGEMVNSELIKRGYARVYRFFSYKRKREFLDLEKRTKKRCAGLWKPLCRK